AEIQGSFGTNRWRAEDIPATMRMSFRNLPLFRRQLGFITFLLTEGTLPARDREIAIIRILWLCGSPNPYGEHVELAKRSNIDAEEVERITRGSAADGWSDHDRAILSAVEQLYDKQTISDEVWDTLAKSWSENQLLEFPIL